MVFTAFSQRAILLSALLVAIAVRAIAQAPDFPPVTAGTALRTNSGEIVIQADKLVAFYDADRLAAQNTYKGKQIAVYGKIERIEKRMGVNGYAIKIESSDSKIHVMGVASDKYLNSVRYSNSGYKLIYEPAGMGESGALYIKNQVGPPKPFLTPPDDVFLRGQLVGLSLGEVVIDISEIVPRRQMKETKGIGADFYKLYNILTANR